MVIRMSWDTKFDSETTSKQLRGQTSNESSSWTHSSGVKVIPTFQGRTLDPVLLLLCPADP